MAQLTISNISLKNQTLYISGKISKNRNDATVTLPKKVIQLMLDLNLFSNPGQYYIFSDDFRPGKEQRSEKAFRDFWIKHVRKDLDFDDQYKFYSLKDTGITNMLRANTDIISVRDQARHSSILITDIYTPKDIKKANKLILNYEGVF
jgi:integrase